MAQIGFIHLRVQSSYSMLESALSITQIIELTRAAYMPAVCLADRGNLFGSLEFAIAASSNGIQPIHGAILNLAYDEPSHFAEVVIIAKDRVGYNNLLKLVSYTFIKNDRAICNHITFADLAAHQEGIIVLSGYTEGIIGQQLLKRDIKQAIYWTKQFQDIFNDRFYFEIMRHDLQKERQIELHYLDIAAACKVALVATSNVLFSDIQMHDMHDVLLCIAGGVTKEYEQRKRVSNQSYFKSSDEMKANFADLPSAIENSYYIAQRCSVMSEPRAAMLPSFTQHGSLAEEDLLRESAITGLQLKLDTKFQRENIVAHQQLSITEQYFERLNYELDVICKMNFAGYFLIVSDFIKWSKEQGIPVGPGRGSGAGSVVAWCLLITDLDPIKFGLIFERFLNPERISMPDFDIDFCQERREEVIEYVRRRYGETKVGQIITFGKMQARAVIKDVARVLSLPYKYADYLTEIVPFNAVNLVTLRQAIEDVAELKSAAEGKGLYSISGEEELIKQVLSTAMVLEGLHRHVSVHAAGIVIAGYELIDVVPLYKDTTSNMLIVQYSMKYAELAGLMKFDFLGLRTLTLIDKCCELLRQRNIIVNINNLTFDDVATYKMLSAGNSTGVFQLESPGMKNILKKSRPDCIEDIIALEALYRPGPMENIPTYIACKHGLQNPDYLHPLLKPVLEETYGVIIYQEQVLESARILAGYTLAAADLLRRAMGKKIKTEMLAQEKKFIAGACNNGIPIEQARSIFATIEKFAGYGFNKAHASAYGVISYQTAYLKANFPCEFLVTCLNLEMGNSDKVNTFIQEIKSNNIHITAPDINTAEDVFCISKQDNATIIYAIGAIKGITADFGKVLVSERQTRGHFKSIIDFVQRVPFTMLNRRLLENLIKAGCFDALHENRNQLLCSIQQLMTYASSLNTTNITGQGSLLSSEYASNDALLVDASCLTNSELAFQEFEVLGLFIQRHPCQPYSDLLKRNNIHTVKHLSEILLSGNSSVKLAGVIQKKDSRMSARGKFVTIQLSDIDGIFDISIFNEDIIKKYAHLLSVKNMVVVYCDAFVDQGGIRFTARSFMSFEEGISNNSSRVLRIYPQSNAELNSVLELLNDCQFQDSSDKNISSVLYLFLPIQEKFLTKIKLSDHLNLNIHYIQRLKQLTVVQEDLIK